MVQRNSPSDCLRPPLCKDLPTRCQQLQKGYAECKRGMVDMRKRFRGNKPVAVSVEIEAGADEPSHQLYAGRPAVSGVEGVTKAEGEADREER